MNEHTPGPWAVWRGEGNTLIIRAHGSELIADIAADDALHPTEREQADARVIAAAPDLLAAAQAIMRTFGEHDTACGGDGCGWCEAIAQTDAAVAKARGREVTP